MFLKGLPGEVFASVVDNFEKGGRMIFLYLKREIKYRELRYHYKLWGAH